jgi:hypothetical protein
MLVKFTLLENRVIHGTEFWTPTNIADGLDALSICIEAWVLSFFDWASWLIVCR